MERCKYVPKKSLGQNFLQDKKALLDIISAGELDKNDNILEIGPGTGALTKRLVKKSRKIILVEKDSALAQDVALNFQFSIFNFQSIFNNQSYNFQNKSGIISGDILKINLPKLIEENDFYDYKIIANIPYYITGKLLRILLETKYKPKLMVLLLQKEVAERICAKENDMNMLAVSVQFYGDPELVGIVEKEKFYPAPKVDSAILKIKIKKDEELIYKTPENIKSFFKIVKAGFSHRRKMLLNNLSSDFGKTKNEIGEIFKKLNLNEKSRAQNLSLNDWKNLSEELI